MFSILFKDLTSAIFSGDVLRTSFDVRLDKFRQSSGYFTDHKCNGFFHVG